MKSQVFVLEIAKDGELISEVVLFLNANKNSINYYCRFVVPIHILETLKRRLCG
ncbi:MAG: hypothetical protein US60_C0047G0006 [Microgenomates group bacterium GW2011_GWC1_37_8]|nr:MAG: hypothetical protein US60_C0047G0006 [Microgenomates group bacterium GW2011_GWC1_37_8]